MSAGPTSIVRRTAFTVLELTAETGRTATLPEIHAAYEARFGPVERQLMSHALGGLVERGEVTKHGRVRKLGYSSADRPVPHIDASDPLPIVLAVLEQATAELKAAVSAAEVHRRLNDLGVCLTSDQVRTRLETLARGSERKRAQGTGRWGEALAERITSKTSAGKNVVLWRLSGAQSKAGAGTPKTEKVREGIRLAVMELNIPVTRGEVIRWARARQKERRYGQITGVVLDRNSSSRFSSVSQRDHHRDGAVETIRTPLTSRGSYPARFAPRPVGDAPRALCALMDAAILLRPSEESLACEHLISYPGGLSPEFRVAVAGARRVAIRQAMEYLVPQVDTLDWSTMLRSDRSASDKLIEWTLLGPEDKFRQDRYSDALRRRSEDLVAMRRFGQAPVGKRSFVTIASFSGVRLEDLQEVAAEVIDLQGLDLNHWRALFAGVPRVRGAIVGGVGTSDLDDVRSWLDRPEAFLSAVRQSHLPRMGALVSSAETVLGSALRDSDLLHEWLRSGVARTPADQEAVIVALGLLGEIPEVNLVWHNTADGQRAAAVVAAVALAVDEKPDRLEWMERLDWCSSGPARVVTEQALFRAQMASRLSVLD